MRTRPGERRWYARLALGVLWMAGPLCLLWIAYFLVLDLPNAAQRGGLRAATVLALVGIPTVISFACGMKLGLVGAVGGALGVIVAGGVAILVGNPILLAIDPASTSITSGTEGASAFFVILFSFFTPVMWLAIGLVGSVVGSHRAGRGD